MLHLFPRQCLDPLGGCWTAALAPGEVYHQWEGCLEAGKGQRWKNGEAEFAFLTFSLSSLFLSFFFLREYEKAAKFPPHSLHLP